MEHISRFQAQLPSLSLYSETPSVCPGICRVLRVAEWSLGAGRWALSPVPSALPLASLPSHDSHGPFASPQPPQEAKWSCSPFEDKESKALWSPRTPACQGLPVSLC